MSVDKANFKEKVVEEVLRFPEDRLTELYDLIHHLRLGIEAAADRGQEKQSQKATPEQSSGSSFLLSIAGIGSSEETDLSERDEDILAQEIDPIRGWGLKRDGTA